MYFNPRPGNLYINPRTGKEMYFKEERITGIWWTLGIVKKRRYVFYQPQNDSIEFTFTEKEAEQIKEKI